MNHGFWVAESLLYLRPSEHVRWLGNGPLMLVWMATLALAIGLVLFIRALRNTGVQVPASLDILGGLVLGGVVANDIEIVTKGSVTDFIWVRAAGVYSAGDVAIALGIALLPLTAVQLSSGRSPVLRVLIGASVTAIDVLYAFLSQHPGLLVAYMMGVISTIGGLAWVGRRGSLALFERFQTSARTLT